MERMKGHQRNWDELVNTRPQQGDGLPTFAWLQWRPMGRGQKGNLTPKSLLPAASPQGSPAMREPDILRLKANVSGALSCTKAPIQPHGGRASTEEQIPVAPLFPGWQFLTAGSMERRNSLSTEEDDLVGGGVATRWSPSQVSKPRSHHQKIRSLGLTLGLPRTRFTSTWPT